MKLVLDEHLSPDVARQLRIRGHDVVAARDLPDQGDRSDAALLRRAQDDGRAIVTADVSDFTGLHRAAVVGGRPHAGLIFISGRRFPSTTRAAGQLVSALDAFLRAHPGERELESQYWWLERA